MCLGAKKMGRYVLPAILALDVLAAAGLVAWARGLGASLGADNRAKAPSGGLALI